MACRYPKAYPWPVFAVGLILAVIGWARGWLGQNFVGSATAGRPARQIAFFSIR